MSPKEEFPKPEQRPQEEELSTSEVDQVPSPEEKPSPERSRERAEKKMERIQSIRRHLSEQADRSPVPLDASAHELIQRTADQTTTTLKECHQEGFGISPSGNPEDNFYDTLWARDLAHAGGNFFARHDEDALIESLDRVFTYQKFDGMLPYRVERKNFLLQHAAQVTGLERVGKLFGFDMAFKYKEEKPIFEGESGGNAEDTIPSLIIALGELSIYSAKGRQFVEDHFPQIEKAMEQFISRTDPDDGLEKSNKTNPDWSDSLQKGDKKLSTINTWYARSLAMMRVMTDSAGDPEKAKRYRELERKVTTSMIGTPEEPGKLYDWDQHAFRTGEGEDRIDTAASVFGCLYLLPATEAVKVQETLKKFLSSKSGLKNFYPPYPSDKIAPDLKLLGMGGYHNEKVWPWITAQNIQAKIKIAREHPDEAVREQYKKEAVEDLADQAKLFSEAGGAWEVFDPETRQKATGLRILWKNYEPPKNLMGNLAAFSSAYDQLKELGWID